MPVVGEMEKTTVGRSVLVEQARECGDLVGRGVSGDAGGDEGPELCRGGFTSHLPSRRDHG